MTKFRLMFDKDKETEWLNEMAANGYAMDSFFAGFYRFSPCEKGQWQYQIDIGRGASFREFMVEMGVEIVQHWGPWVIVRREASVADGEFVLYSDVDSWIAQYKKILILFKIVTIIELLGLFYMIYVGMNGVTSGWAGACLIGAFVVVFINMILRTREKLDRLAEKKGEAPKRLGRNRVSLMFSAAMVINAFSFRAADHLSRPVRVALLVVALFLIILGTVKTVSGRKEI